MTLESGSSSIVKDSGSSTIMHVDIKASRRSGSESSHLTLQDLQCDFHFDLFCFKLSENGSVLSVENVYCMTYHKVFAYHRSNTLLIYHLQRAHDSTSDPCVFV